MDFIKKLFAGTSVRPNANFLPIRVKCSRCGETVEGRVNMANDLSLTDNDSGYYVRKVLMGGGRCFQQIEVELRFDASRKLLEKSIHGGAFIE